MGFARLVAIKAMHPEYAKDPSFASMFVDEARLTARLRHPDIVPTLDIVADSGHRLIVMEYVEGESLSSLLRIVRDANDRIPVAVASAVIHDLLLGLHEAHDDDGSPLSIIHRDVSPQKFIVGLDGLARPRLRRRQGAQPRCTTATKARSRASSRSRRPPLPAASWARARR